MTESILEQLALSLPELGAAPASLRNRVLSLLARWQAWQELLDCLDYLDQDELVTFKDWQARALEGLGQIHTAIQVMETRIAQRNGTPARGQLARLYLAAGETQQALALAQQLVAEHSGAGVAWNTLGEIYLGMGRLAEAEAAFRRGLVLVPASRQAVIGLMHVHHRQGDSIGAAAYAVRAYTVDPGEHPLAVPILRDLLAFFAATGDNNRRQAAEEQLAQRYQEELHQLRNELASASLSTRPAARPRRLPVDNGARAGTLTSTVQTLLPDLNTIPVSEQERQDLLEAARTHFGFSSLLPGQAEIMASARRGEHVLAILPTGAGKSLCYQLAAMLDPGTTLVISPLIALMKDQIDNLPATIRPHAIALNSTVEGAAMQQALEDIARGRYKLIYAAPERLRQPPFLHALRQSGLTRLVIDEAHCVSVWGHDFRPDYLYLARVQQQLGTPALLALTATAPPRVRQDIERQLLGAPAGSNTARMRLVATDVFRPNLGLHVQRVRNEDEKRQRLVTLCTSLPGSGIVYARTRQRCEELAAMLQGLGVQAEFYHAGIEQRAAVQERFLNNQVRVIVATIAFGMGIDKPDIRFVIHYGLPDSIEAYYQEIGRAGRDGQPATCVMLYTTSDRAVLSKHAREDLTEVELLRAAYRAIKTRLREQNPGSLAFDDLLRDLQIEETRAKVALSILEQAGHLVRYADAPRMVGLRLCTPSPDAALAEFAERAHLPLDQMVSRRFMELAAMTGLPANTLEDQLLAWRQAGWLEVHTSGRDLLLSLNTTPATAPGGRAPEIPALLDQYATIQQQRVIEIVDYARAKHCRHGHLAAYLGGIARQHCQACDNCGAVLPDPTTTVPDNEAQQRLVLQALARQSWGRRNLIALLRGDSTAHERARTSESFGALSFRSQAAVNSLIDQLVSLGAIAEIPLAHGGIALGITPQGRRLLNRVP